LEREEEERLQELQSEMNLEDEVEDLTPEDKELLLRIKQKKRKMIQTSRLNKQTRKNKPVLPRTSSTKNLSDFASHLKEMGIDETAVVERARSRSRSRIGRKRKRDDEGDVDMGEAGVNNEMPDAKKKKMSRSISRSRSLSTRRSLSQTPGDGFKNEKHKAMAEVLQKKSHKQRNKLAKAGEADRTILTKMPKHLFSGKRGQGKTQRR